MKKFLISLLLILLIIFTFFLGWKNVKIAKWSSKNIKQVEELGITLDNKIKTATELKQQQYPQSIENIEQSIETLKKTKKNYEDKIKYISDNVELNVVKTKEYKVERIWIAFQKYAKQENVELEINILDTNTKGYYDLNVSVVGDYINITDFIYDIEKDDTLGFKILNFKLVPTTSTQTTTKTETKTDSTTKTDDTNETDGETKTEDTTTTTTVYVDKLIGTFKIEGIAIDFD